MRSTQRETLLGMFDVPSTVDLPAVRPRRVKPTSSRVFHMYGQFKGRAGEVYRALVDWDGELDPTTGELAGVLWRLKQHSHREWHWVLFRARRGMSDLKTIGVVEH